jgi:hypothetical protein
MKDIKPIFVPYDDNNLSHVMAGQDYGQIDTGSKSTFWDEIDSPQYSDFVDYLSEKIINHKIKLFSS